jgi:hypothetical protein
MKSDLRAKRSRKMGGGTPAILSGVRKAPLPEPLNNAISPALVVTVSTRYPRTHAI